MLNKKSLPLSPFFFLMNLALFVLLVSNFTYSQKVQSELTNYLNEYHKITGVPSVSAGVMHDGKIIWLDAAGYSDLENDVKATPQTVYRIASISKIITAVAIMQLVEKGKINLDRDARRYIPYFPKKKWVFTVRQILTHTSGIRSYKKGEFDNPQHFSSTRDALGLILNDSLQFKPGTKYMYTTFGYNLLAAIIENVSGLSFTEYLKKNIFKPAEMTSTFPEFPSDIISHRARGYVKNDYRQIRNAPLADLSEKFAGGGLISTSGDLLNFSSALLEGKLIKSETLDSMLVIGKLTNGTPLKVGLGLEVNKDNHGNDYFGHYGSGTGFVSLLVIYRKLNLAAVDLVNLNDRTTFANQPAFNLAHIALNEKFELPKKSLSDEMFKVTSEYSLDSAIAFYNNLESDSTNHYENSIKELDQFGDDLINTKQIDKAIYFYKLMVRRFTKTSAMFIGLGKAYYQDGNKGLALKNFLTALKFDSNNKYAIKMITELSAK